MLGPRKCRIGSGAGDGFRGRPRVLHPVLHLVQPRPPFSGGREPVARRCTGNHAGNVRNSISRGVRFLFKAGLKAIRGILDMRATAVVQHDPGDLSSTSVLRDDVRFAHPRPLGNRRHSGVGLHTPADVHYGCADAVRAARGQALDLAYAAHPERFVRKPPEPPRLPDIAWINKPPQPTESSEVTTH